MAYSGEMQWRTRAGDEIAARLGEPLTKDLTAQALRTALDPSGSWIPSVLAAADSRLSEVRRHVPDAGGLVIATDQDSARAYAKILRADHGRGADRRAVRREGGVEEDRGVHRRATGRWMVAVRMVSEGVDVPRLAVGVYATTTSTPLFFAQAVGRFVRARKRGETASVFLPSVPTLLGLRLRDGGRARPRARPQDHRRGRHLRRRERPARPGERRRGAPPTSCEHVRSRRSGSRGPLRPGALRRRRVRPRGRGARRLGGGDGLPRHPGPARARPDARAAAAAAERPARKKQKAAPDRSRTPSPR